LTLLVLSALLLITLQAAYAQNETVLYDFGAVPNDGANPESSVTVDSKGNFYGSTWGGGNGSSCPANAHGCGTVYELSPNASGYSETLLYSFCSQPGCSDGQNPAYSYVTFDSQGNLYGTTFGGGAIGDGVVFELSPQPESGCPAGSNTGNGWCETVLYSFVNSNPYDVENPVNGLIWDESGNLYGAAHSSSGPAGRGGVYELSPEPVGGCPAGSSTGNGWCETVLYYTSTHNYAGLAMDDDGNIYGVGSEGLAEGIFELFADRDWTPVILHTFAGAPDGSGPEGTPVLDSDGNIYGTTTAGGSKNDGAVWKLSPGAGGWVETVLYSFTGGKTGPYNPVGGVVLDSSGNIYGTTVNGGKEGNNGIVYELELSGSTYTPKTLWNFNHVDGLAPYASLIFYDGNIYGTTSQGGPAGDAFGNVFELNPTEAAQKPTITSVSTISAAQYQTITINGSGFGIHQPYAGDSDSIVFNDVTGSWQAGYTPSGNCVTLIVNSWTDSQIVLGGFSGCYGGSFVLHANDKISIGVWNAQTGLGPGTKKTTVGLKTTTTLASSPNPSTEGETVIFAATVSSSGGAPPDGETVSFMSGTTTLGTGFLSSGQATFSTSILPVGRTSVTAVYGGDSTFDGNQSKRDRQVVKAGD
jgi:uncharacterized repeat protein (TIGR03803 family)